jgi:hypothetical protein
MFAFSICGVGVPATHVEVSNFCSYLIDSITILREQGADLHLACVPKLHYEHNTALAPR